MGRSERWVAYSNSMNGIGTYSVPESGGGDGTCIQDEINVRTATAQRIHGDRTFSDAVTLRAEILRSGVVHSLCSKS